MKTYMYEIPSNTPEGETVVRTEKQIIEEFYDYWKQKMIKKFGEERFEKEFTEKDCIEDWIVENWAWEVK